MLHIRLRSFPHPARRAGGTLLLLAAMGTALVASAQPADFPPELAAMFATCETNLCEIDLDWKRNNFMFFGIAQAMPEDLYEYKPTEAQQTFGERVMHVADTNVQLLITLGGKTPAPTFDVKATSKESAIAALQQSIAYGAALIAEFGEQGLTERVASPWFMGEKATRQRIINFLGMHVQDTYGQLVVYLRLNGITPPLSAGL